MPTPIGKYDEIGQRLIFAAADLTARIILADIAEAECDAGNERGACSFMHAEGYLRDRLGYELAPWPKHCFPNPEYVDTWGKELP